MRVTIVISGLGGGGAERVCVNLANAWAATGGRQITILTTARGAAGRSVYAIDPRVERRSVGWPPTAHGDELSADLIAPVVRGLHHARCPELIEQIALIAMLRRAILATAPDVVVAHIDMTNVRVLAAMHETGVPVIACEHTDTSQVGFRWQNARTALYRRAQAVVAPHQSIAQWLARRGVAAHAIPNPLVAPSPPVRVGRRDERRRLVTLARLSPEKRLDLLVRAFARIAGDFPEWVLEVYGDGPLRASLARLANELAPGRIQFRGFVNSAYSVLGDADLFVSTSWVEGFGNAIWEALACGVPVVVMDCGAPVRSLVRDGVDGLIVRAGSAEALGAALASVMGDDAARKSFAAHAPEVITRFSIESSLRAWDVLLDNAAVSP